jgi:hypothetical protein
MTDGPNGNPAGVHPDSRLMDLDSEQRDLLLQLLGTYILNTDDADLYRTIGETLFQAIPSPVVGHFHNPHQKREHYMN